MSKGYDSAERESRERRAETQLCEAYACAELAVATVHGAHYCEGHRPPADAVHDEVPTASE